MKTMRLRSLVRHLSMPGTVFGMLALVFAIRGDRPDVAKLALALFVLAALSTLIAYWTRDPVEELGLSDEAPDSSNRLIVRYDEARFVSLTLAVTLGVMSVIWLVTHASEELPPEVALFALPMACFVAASMVWVAHLREQLRHLVPQSRPPLRTHLSRHAS